MIYVIEIIDKLKRRATKEYDAPSLLHALRVAEDELRAYPQFWITDVWEKGKGDDGETGLNGEGNMLAQRREKPRPVKQILSITTIALLLILAVPVMAESSYCLSGPKLLWDESADERSLETVATMCKPGDIISFPANDLKKTAAGMEALPIIQRLCDFDKTIYNA
jgi:hypothetical protein